MKRVESVWASLSKPTSLSKRRKVDLSNTTEIKALIGRIEGYMDAASELTNEFDSLLKDYDSIRDRLTDLAQQASQVQTDMFETGLELDRAEADMIKKASELGVGESMVLDILSDLDIDVEAFLIEARAYGDDLNNIVGRSGSLPEFR